MNITIADFSFGHNEINTNPIAQWDYGQVLRIKGLNLPPAVEIHFAIVAINSYTSVPAIGITSGNFTDVDIPDELLRQPKPLKAYVYIANVDSGTTTKVINIPIMSRQKPTIPCCDDGVMFRHVIEKCNAALQASKQTASDAEQTTSDRIAVENMVDSIQGVGDQLNAIEKIGQQVRDDATQVSKDKDEVIKIKDEIIGSGGCQSDGMPMTQF